MKKGYLITIDLDGTLIQGFDKLIQANSKLVIAQENSSNAIKNTQNIHSQKRSVLQNGKV